MKAPGPELPLVVVKWYAYAKWVLERVESFPKSQRFILGQRLSNHVMDVPETRQPLARRASHFQVRLPVALFCESCAFLRLKEPPRNAKAPRARRGRYFGF